MDASFPPARFKIFLSGITLFIALTFIILSSFHDAYSALVTLEWDPNADLIFPDTNSTTVLHRGTMHRSSMLEIHQLILLPI